MKKIISASLFTLIASQGAFAEQAEKDNVQLPQGLYAGGGISYNDLDFGSVIDGADNESALGLQAFIGVPISTAIKGFDAFAELGFFRTNNFKFGEQKERITGVSGSAVIQRNLIEVDPNLYGLARIGIEFGDDDGVFMGVGAGYRILPNVEVRAEFVNKDLITSYQGNMLFRF